MLISRCNVCGFSGAHKLYTISSFDEPFNIVRCGFCNTMYQYPQLKQEFYDEGYYKGTSTYSYDDERGHEIIKRIEDTRRVRNIRKFVSGSLLDVGCSFGSLVRCANREGFIAEGIDVSPYIAEYAKSADVRITQKDVCDGIDGKYDVITMIEVIEHLSDVSKALRNCHDALTFNGLLVIQTTNMDSIVRQYEGGDSWYFLPGHTFYFSETTLRKALRINGFKIEKIYYGHETGLMPALVRKMITNSKRHGMQDWLTVLYTIVCHALSKIHIGNFTVHNGMVVYARRV